MSSSPDRPQFLHLPTGFIVFPDGYPPEELAPLPETYWPERDAEDAVAAIKVEAARQILEIAPLWQQLNDLRAPTPEGDARFAEIDKLRAKSNEAEIAVAADVEGTKNG